MARSSRKQRERRTARRKAAENRAVPAAPRPAPRVVTETRVVHNQARRPVRRSMDARLLTPARDVFAATGRDGSKRYEAASKGVQRAAPEAKLARPGEAYTSKPVPLQDNTKLDALDRRMCKPRPAPSRGGGKGRSFIPWCK